MKHLLYTLICFAFINQGISQTNKAAKKYINPFDTLKYDKVIAYDYNGSPEMQIVIEGKVMPLKDLLDPQGKAVMGGLSNLGLQGVADVRIGKNISMQIDAATADEAKAIAEEAAKKLLANPVMEQYEISVN